MTESSIENNLNLSQNVAAMDLGTNSNRLLIVQPDGKILHRDVRHVALGEGLAEKGHFSSASQERAICSFMDFRTMLDVYQVKKYRAIATAACRMSANTNELLQEIKKQSGIDVEVISEYEEARLTLLGAQQNAPKDKKYLFVYDLGGGSTEVTLAENSAQPKILATISVPLGARNASEIFKLKNYNRGRGETLVKQVKTALQPFLDEIKKFDYEGNVALVATSSTPLRLAAATYKMPQYDKFAADGKKLTTAKLDRLIGHILHMPYEARCASPYIGRNRADIFVAAVLIFRAVYQSLGVKEMTASLKGAQEAITAELI